MSPAPNLQGGRHEPTAGFDWAAATLPETWPDRLRPWLPWEMAQLAWSFVRKRRPVQLPADLPGAATLPKYLLQEFHNLPNGNYSHNITHDYVRQFERVMLGCLTGARAHMASHLLPATDLLDVGSGGGSTGAQLLAAGAGAVTGVEPSPYLLRHAARRHPRIRFVQGLAEHLPFEAASFDAVAVCFVLHELPPSFMRRALREFHRVLRRGGRLAICEPGPTQWRRGAFDLWRRHGWRGVYFRLLAKRAHEPFVGAWHDLDPVAELQAAGFTAVRDEEQFPTRHLQASVG
ncbi:MAG: class I SAM-dependent methyltransferase [Planctomycetes bacterium]|nr:class I SAM-dependent methyltransferase [Planctomycetota bacterium]